MAEPIITQLFKLVPAPTSSLVAATSTADDEVQEDAADFGVVCSNGLTLDIHQIQNGQPSSRSAKRKGGNGGAKFEYDPSVHSTADWTQSQRYGQYYDILCVNGTHTNFVVCKLCRARFTKRSTDSLKSHATEHGFSLGGIKDDPELSDSAKRRSNRKSSAEFKFDARIHSTAEWSQSSLYGQHFWILLEHGCATEHVLCKICRARFTKRSTDSMRIHLAKHKDRCEVDAKSAMELSLAKFMAYTGQPASLVDNPAFMDFLRHYELHCHQRRELAESVDPRDVLPSMAKLAECQCRMANQGFLQDLSRSLSSSYHHNS